jgi:hypothetical protein
MNELQLLRIDADISFTYDARGRMLLSNEPLESARRPAPRVLIGSTRIGSLIRFRADVPDSVASADYEPAALRVALAPITDESGGPSYRFGETIVGLPGAVSVTQHNREVVRDTFSWLYDEVADWQPTFAVVRDGQAVSICFSSRIGTHAAAAGVETLSDFRGRGYATSVTAAWAAAVRAAGHIPLYGTSWDNLASQGIARRLGLIQFAEVITWT